jgi:tripartite-type tricarboxylate transporter receptor subunit TctC
MTHRTAPRTRRLVTASLIAAGLLGAACMPLAQAQPAWPDKPIVLVVPYSAGGPTDVVARVLAGPMGRSLGQTVVVENTVGAGGTLAGARVARSKADGYTVLFQHMGMATAPALYKKLSFDPLKDFDYIGQVMDVPMTLLTRKDLPVANFQELLAYMKKNGDKVSMAHAGIGAVSQLCALLFTSQLGLTPTQIPYKGAGPALNDLMGGQVDVLCDQTTSTGPVIKDGTRVKVFGVTTPKRLAAFPNVPTLAEQGVTGFDVKVWHGMYVAKGTPKDVTAKLNVALRAALHDDMVKARLAELSSEIVTMDKVTPESLRAQLQSETLKWGKVIREARIEAE